MKKLACFKAYDIRGQVPSELDEKIANRIGAATTKFLNAGSCVVGHDIRTTSPQLAEAVANGAMQAGADVLDIGQCGTEEVYFATDHLGADAGIMVTASHNPADYNGMKLVRHGSRPISGDTGLNEIHDAVASGGTLVNPGSKKGKKQSVCLDDAYVKHLLSYVDGVDLAPLRVVVNAGNGGAGRVVDLLARHLPFEFTRIHHEPDGTFPNGVPNPLLEENRASTAEAVVRTGAAFGVAWDGDFDRCFLFDESGDFIEGYYIVGLLANAILEREPGGRIVHDPRLVWNTIDVVAESGGEPVMSKTGHAFIKERMRKENAVYGGEMSAHHYFRNFAYCDSGMIPWLLVARIMSERQLELSRLVAERVEKFPASGEINRRVPDAGRAIDLVQSKYLDDAEEVDNTDGLSLSFGDWRFNLRSSNTEPVLRLNVESRGNRELMQARTREILELIDSLTA